MKVRFWWCLWMALAALQALGLLAISGLDWFTGRLQRVADAAEINMLIATAEQKLSARRRRKAKEGAQR